MSHKTFISNAEEAPTSQIGATLESLFATIESRKGADAGESYTKRLMEGKLDDLLKKVSEESLESCLAAKECQFLHESLFAWDKSVREAGEDGEVEDGGNGRAGERSASSVLAPSNVVVEDADSQTITDTMQRLAESMKLAQAINDCDRIRKTAKRLDSSIDHLRYEAADVIYHLLVLLAKFDVPLEELAAELNARMKEEERPKGCVMLDQNHVKRGK